MRENGNTVALVRAVLDEVAKAGIETGHVSLAGKTIGPCTGCERCQKEDFCSVQDDWDAIAERMLEAEVVVLGAPTYYYDVNGRTKNFIDQTYSLYHRRRLAGRGGVAVVVQANAGDPGLPKQSRGSSLPTSSSRSGPWSETAMPRAQFSGTRPR